MATDAPGQKRDKKNLVRETQGMVTAGPGEKSERGRPLSIKLPLIDGRQTPVNCCIPDCRKYDGAEQKGANSAF